MNAPIVAGALFALAFAPAVAATVAPPFTPEPEVLAQFSQTVVAPSGYIESVEATGPHVWLVIKSDAVRDLVWRVDVGTLKALAASGWDKLLVPKARIWVNGRASPNARYEAAAARIVLASPEVNILENHSGPLTDDDIIAYARRAWSKRYWMNQSVALGELNGVRVIAEYPCGDICPDYTNRVIRYEVRAGPDCDRIGGISQQLILMSGAVGTFCVPKVLIDRGLQLPDEHRRLRQ
jgi:hypothetical protein